MESNVLTAQQIISELEPLGSESYCRILRNHGVTGPLYGVKISELKKYEKAIKKDYQLALDLYNSGIYDAMYLAGLIADEKQMSQSDLQAWLDNATSETVAEFAVAWVAADGPHGWDLALKWIDSDDTKAAVTGWGTLSSWVAVKKCEDLDIPALDSLLDRIEKTIHSQNDAVRYKMNGFVIAVGTHVPELTDRALAIGESIGKVEVDMGNTDCKVPYSPDYIRKAIESGKVGKKRKSARC